MEKVLLSVEELNALMISAVQNALDARERKEGETTLISRDAAARRLGVDVSTLWRWNKSGYLKVSTRIGRSCWYTEASLKRIERGEREA